MATTIYSSQSSKPPSLPQLGIDSSMAPQPTSRPSPPQTKDDPPPPTPPAPPAPSGPPANSPETNYRLLSQDEWVQFCRGVCVFKDDESQEIVRPTSTLWPPKGFKDGLYQDVLCEKTKFTYWFYLLSAVRWILMILQLAMNAVMTALGSMAYKNGTSITVIAAVNTCVSGMLALMHNSGLPDRYRSDRNEFYKLEERLKSIVDTRLVPADQSINEVLASCFAMFRHARQTVQNNIPQSYTPAAPAPAPAPAPGKPAAKASQNIEPKK
ncbi:hypothetical protein F5B20DRAFT_165966 [Whalleya microplaca]|nr:hypothetical protein F5B20DRAFT_165966 [Whalleya microplaca]